LVKLEDETPLGNNTVAKNPIRKIDRKSKAIQFENCEKLNENEVSRMRSVDLRYIVEIESRGKINFKRESIFKHYFKTLIVSIK